MHRRFKHAPTRGRRPPAQLAHGAVKPCFPTNEARIRMTLGQHILTCLGRLSWLSLRPMNEAQSRNPLHKPAYIHQYYRPHTTPTQYTAILPYHHLTRIATCRIFIPPFRHPTVTLPIHASIVPFQALRMVATQPQLPELPDSASQFKITSQFWALYG